MVAPLWERSGGAPPKVRRSTLFPASPPRGKVEWDTPLLPCYLHLVVITGDMFKLVHLRTYPPTPPVMTPSGGHRKASGRYASYWNAFLSYVLYTKVHDNVHVFVYVTCLLKVPFMFFGEGDSRDVLPSLREVTFR